MRIYDLYQLAEKLRGNLSGGCHIDPEKRPVATAVIKKMAVMTTGAVMFEPGNVFRNDYIFKSGCLQGCSNRPERTLFTVVVSAGFYYRSLFRFRPGGIPGIHRQSPGQPGQESKRTFIRIPEMGDGQGLTELEAFAYAVEKSSPLKLYLPS